MCESTYILIFLFRTTNMVGSETSGHDDDLASLCHPSDAPVTRAEYDAFVSHFQRELRVLIMSVQEEMQKVMQQEMQLLVGFGVIWQVQPLHP